MPDYDPTQPITRPLYPNRADTIVHTFILKKARCIVFARPPGYNAIWLFRALQPTGTPSNIAAPPRPTAWIARDRPKCHAAGQVKPSDYGRIVRINLIEHDRRIFTPTPYGSPSWRRGYHRRSALERINNRIDNSFGFEHHFIRGQGKIQTRVGLALAVMMAMTLGHVKAGRIEQMRSLVQPIRNVA